MNFDSVSSSGIGGLIGGGLVLLKDIFLGVNKRLSRVEKKLDEVVNNKTCETIRSDTKLHIQDIKDDMKYIRSKLDDVIVNVQRHREDYKP